MESNPVYSILEDFMNKATIEQMIKFRDRLIQTFPTDHDFAKTVTMVVDLYVQEREGKQHLQV